MENVKKEEGGGGKKGRERERERKKKEKKKKERRTLCFRLGVKTISVTIKRTKLLKWWIICHNSGQSFSYFFFFFFFFLIKLRKIM